MRSICILFSVIIVLICAIWSFHLRDPHLLFVRNYETSILLFLLVFTFVLTKSFKRKYQRQIVQIIAVILIVFVSVKEYRFQVHKHRLLDDPTSDEKKINSRLIVGFRDFDEVGKLSLNGVAGIFLSSRNIEGKSFEQLSARIEKLQHERSEAGLPLLIVATANYEMNPFLWNLK